MGPSYFDLFVGSFMVTIQFLIVIVGSFTAAAVCIAAIWITFWSIGLLWGFVFAQSEDASRKRGE